MKRLVPFICVLTTLERPWTQGARFAVTQIFAKVKKKVIGVLFLTGLIVVASCELTPSTKPPAMPVEETDALVVFLTGNELGALKPCGCSGGQLGGLDRRSAVFNGVPEQKRLIVDTGTLVEGDSEQDLIKFKIITEAFNRIGYDLVNLTEKDIEIGKNLAILEDIGSNFDIISSQRTAEVNLPAKFTKRLSLKSKTVAVTIAAFDAKAGQIEQIGELFQAQPGVQTVNILILNQCDAGLIDSIAKKAPLVDCLVCPAESDEPMIIGDPNKRPFVFSVGRFGRYVSSLHITAAKGKDNLQLSFLSIPVEEALEPENSLVELYKDYQQLVRASNLLEKYPRVPLPEDLEYAGSESCNKVCHADEYEKWQAPALREPAGEAHSKAYATLERVGSQFDPECVVCHVVGMKYEGGFVSEEKTGHLKNVGCENCHGPGSEHIRTAGQTQPTGPKSVCLDCHTPEHSGDYAGNERSFLEKIIHWEEPNAASDVK